MHILTTAALAVLVLHLSLSSTLQENSEEVVL